MSRKSISSIVYIQCDYDAARRRRIQPLFLQLIRIAALLTSQAPLLPGPEGDGRERTWSRSLMLAREFSRVGHEGKLTGPCVSVVQLTLDSSHGLKSLFLV